MLITSAPPTAYLVGPQWLILQHADKVHAVDLHGRGSIDFDGVLGRMIFDTSIGVSGMPEALRSYHPLYRQFQEAAQSQPFVPLTTRGDLLRGVGYRQLFLELTARCNEQCGHCYAESSPARTEELTMSAVEVALTDAKALGFTAVQLTGGDPLVSDLCVPAARLAAELRFATIEIYTNGLALRGKLYEQLRSLPVAFAFSFYSHDPGVHDAITGTPGSQRRTLTAITQVCRDGIPFRIGVIAMEANAGQIDDTLAFLERLGVPGASIGVDTARSVGRGVFPRRSKQGVPVGKQSGIHKSKAHRGFAGSAAVAPDGTVYPCIFSRNVPLGNIYTHGLRGVLTDPKPVAIEQTILESAHRRWTERLSCWECRIRTALLTA